MNKEKTGKKKILCSCGTCCSTCTIADEIARFLMINGVDVDFIKCNNVDIEKYSNEVDLIISPVQLPPKINRPKINSVPLFTGNGLEKIKAEILKILK